MHTPPLITSLCRLLSPCFHSAHSYDCQCATGLMAPSLSPVQDRGRLEEAEELYRQVLESSGRLSYRLSSFQGRASCRLTESQEFRTLVLFRCVECLWVSCPLAWLTAEKVSALQKQRLQYFSWIMFHAPA